MVVDKYFLEHNETLARSKASARGSRYHEIIYSYQANRLTRC